MKNLFLFILLSFFIFSCKGTSESKSEENTFNNNSIKKNETLFQAPIEHPTVVISEEKKSQCRWDYTLLNFDHFCKVNQICFNEEGEFLYENFSTQEKSKEISLEYLKIFVKGFEEKSKNFLSNCELASPSEYGHVKKIAKIILEKNFLLSVKRKLYDFIDYCNERDINTEYVVERTAGVTCESFMRRYQDYHTEVMIYQSREHDVAHYVTDLYFLKGLEKITSLEVIGNFHDQDFDLSHEPRLDLSSLKGFYLLRSFEFFNRNIDLETIPSGLNNLQKIKMYKVGITSLDGLEKLEHLQEIDIQLTRVKDLMVLKNLEDLQKITMDDYSKQKIKKCPNEAKSQALINFCKSLNIP